MRFSSLRKDIPEGCRIFFCRDNLYALTTVNLHAARQTLGVGGMPANLANMYIMVRGRWSRNFMMSAVLPLTSSPHTRAYVPGHPIPCIGRPPPSPWVLLHRFAASPTFRSIGACPSCLRLDYLLYSGGIMASGLKNITSTGSLPFFSKFMTVACIVEPGQGAPSSMSV